MHTRSSAIYSLRELAKTDPDKYDDEIECIVFENLTDTEVAKLQLSENLLRRGLSAFEIGRQLLTLQEELEQHMKKQEVAEFAGLSPSEYTHYIKVMRLPQKTLQAIEFRNISDGHSAALVRLLPKQRKGEEPMQLTDEQAEQIDKLTEHIISKSLSVEKTRDIVDKMLDEKPKKEKKAAEPEGVYQGAESQLRAQYGDDLILHVNKKGAGYIKIPFEDAAAMNGIRTEMTFRNTLREDYPEIYAQLIEKVGAERVDDMLATGIEHRIEGVDYDTFDTFISACFMGQSGVEPLSKEVEDELYEAIKSDDATLSKESPYGDCLYCYYNWRDGVYRVKFGQDSEAGVSGADSTAETEDILSEPLIITPQGYATAIIKVHRACEIKSMTDSGADLSDEETEILIAAILRGGAIMVDSENFGDGDTVIVYESDEKTYEVFCDAASDLPHIMMAGSTEAGASTTPADYTPAPIDTADNSAPVTESPKVPHDSILLGEDGEPLDPETAPLDVIFAALEGEVITPDTATGDAQGAAPAPTPFDIVVKLSLNEASSSSYRRNLKKATDSELREAIRIISTAPKSSKGRLEACQKELARREQAQV